LTEQNEKRASGKETLLRLMGYLWRHKARMLLAIAFTLAGNILALLVPKYAGQAIDAIGSAGNVNFTNVFAICAEMIVAVLPQQHLYVSDAGSPGQSLFFDHR